MIDAQSRYGADADKIDNQLVRRVENLRQFHPDRRQIVYVKEAAIINFLRGHAPKGEPVRLRIQKFIQFIEAAGIAWPTIDLSERLFDGLLHLRRFLTTPLQATLD